MNIFLESVGRAVERYADTDLASNDPTVAAARYAIFAGGKRLRPALVLATAFAFREPDDPVHADNPLRPDNPGHEQAQAADHFFAGTPDGNREKREKDLLAVAVAFEYIHTYSLIHDDLPVMDNDAMRRGRPACHVAFGVETAVKAGALLIVKAFAALSNIGFENRDRIIETLSEASGPRGMVGGQALDILGEDTPADPAALQKIHSAKTAALIRGAMMAGALTVLSPNDKGKLDTVDEVGFATGLAFQIVDDLLDVESTSEVMGKPVGQDDAKGKRTYPAVMGVAASRARATELIATAEAGLKRWDKQDTILGKLVAFVLKRER